MYISNNNETSLLLKTVKRFVEEELYLPKEDDCITFEGAHAQQYPTYGRRVVLVATYMSLSNEGYMDKVEELNNRKEFKA